ncbi:hypothetical protein CEXT_668051 [Caerostris extrusa]|uniref:Uncharacterized protein n=1 Tax=Caerostris extrusa TaxID=172846 RepID=A0AAV4NN72_CAEEX|nr:hypothetical protein CEXT_668051 [Caerostris extrusa]
MRLSIKKEVIKRREEVSDELHLWAGNQVHLDKLNQLKGSYGAKIGQLNVFRGPNLVYRITFRYPIASNAPSKKSQGLLPTTHPLPPTHH